MTQSKAYYELSKEADQDLDEIFDYTETVYGFDQAVEYISQFEGLFERLLENPALGRRRNEIRPGLRSFPKLEHVVFYRVLQDHILIIRVLHAHRDISKM